MIALNLQRFAAGEKTERATQKRRDDARKEGNVSKSPELTSALVLAAILVVMRLTGRGVWDAWQNLMNRDFTMPLPTSWTAEQVSQMLLMQGVGAAKSLLPMLGVGFIMAVGIGMAQVRPMFALNLLAPKFNRIQPFEGLKRMFSSRSLVDLGKSILKLTIVGVTSYSVISQLIGQIGSFSEMSVQQLPPTIGGMVFALGIRIAVMMVVLAFMDFLYQRFEYEKKLRMTKQEVKDETKQMEGNPEVKSQIRKRSRELAFHRMMEDVPKADVVVTNPTHFAIALKYDGRAMAAPRVVAKGADLLAQQVKQRATQSGVPVIENKPLAQTLYRAVDVGDDVPEDLYQAVAEVLAYVYRLRRTGRNDSL